MERDDVLAVLGDLIAREVAAVKRRGSVSWYATPADAAARERLNVTAVPPDFALDVRQATVLPVAEGYGARWPLSDLAGAAAQIVTAAARRANPVAYLDVKDGKVWALVKGTA